MKLQKILSAFLAISCGLLFSSAQVHAQEGPETDRIVVTEEGDSTVLYKPNYYDFGALNQGAPDMHKRLEPDSPLAAGKDMDALRLDALNRDKKRLMSVTPRLMSLNAAEGVDQTRPVGKIPVQEGMTPTGARTYSVPVSVIQSLDFVPQIALSYNSQGGQGVAGYGWSISGLSSITIANRTQYYNGAPKAVNYMDTDHVYTLDGIPLVQNEKSSLAGEFQLETARGHIVVKKHLSGGEVSHFTALYPDGSRATFGNDGYTGIMRYTYPITEIEDVRGNRIVFKYKSYATNYGHKYYITSIEYGFGSDDTPAGKIEFSYDWDDLSHLRYYAGIETRFAYLLKSVSSYNGSKEICRYDLTHEQKDNDYLLTVIDSESDGTALNPLKFSYGDDPLYPSDGGKDDLLFKDQLFLSSYFNSGDAEIIYRSGKLIEGSAGDGMIAYPNFSNYNVIGYKKKWFGGKKHDLYGSTYSPDQKILIAPVLSGVSDVQSITVGEGFQHIDLVDTDADGTDELVKINFAGLDGNSTILNITVYEFNASRALVVKSSFNVNVDGVVNNGDIAYSPAQRVYIFGDFRGDGKTMLMTTLYNQDPNGAGRTSYTALIDIAAQTKLSETHIIDLVRNSNEHCLRSHDVDSDGRMELCWATQSGLDVYNVSGSSFTRTRTIAGLDMSMFPKFDNKYQDMFVADINGDGYMDFIHRINGTYIAYRYTGERYKSQLMSLQKPGDNDELMFYDVNNDGLADLIQRSGTRLYFFMNSKGTISTADKITSSVTLSDGAKFLPCNSNNYNSLSNFIAIDGAYVKAYDFSKDRAKDRLLTTFIDSHGVVTVNEYEDMSTSSTVYSIDKDRKYSSAFGRKSFSLYLLHTTRTYTSSERMTQLKSLFYRYCDAVSSWQGLGFCGFGKVETTDFMTATNEEIVTSVTYDPTMFGVDVSVKQAFRLSHDSPFSATIKLYTNKTYPHKKLNPLPLIIIESDKQTGVFTTTTYSYTDYDLPLSISSNKTLDSRGSADIAEKAQYTYSNYVSSSLYLLGQVKSCTVTKTRPGAEKWTELQKYEYDSDLMLPTKKTEYADSAGRNKVRETRWTYDGFGNVTSEKTASYNSTTFIGDSYTYDSDGMYLLSHTDALGHKETYSGHNKFGKPVKVTDHKGRVTEISYDEWGNEVSRTYPDGTEERTSLEWGGIGLYTVTRYVTGKPTEVTHYDAGDRKLRSGVLRYDGSWLYTDSSYDDKGRLEKESMPFKGNAAGQWNKYEYDEYKRLVKFTEASGKVTSWTYDSLTVSETRNGITTSRTMDAGGSVSLVEDSGGTITYTYRSDGQLSSAGRNGGTASSGKETMVLEYDDFGRRVAIVDPSAGRQTDKEVWAADGTSTVTHTNPNGTVITSRDRFGRTVKVERKGEYTTTYTYDQDGLLTGETSTNGTSKSYTYDSFDRLSSETETVPDGKWLRKDYTYTDGSIVSAIKYTSQSGEITTEVYTYANGHNTSVSTVDGHTVWAITQENSLGLPTKAVTGTVERTYSYTAYGQISGRTMGDVQRFAYSFSTQTGNLSSRTDQTRSKTESFGYDDLNRLTDNNGKSISYSDNGNITSMESVGAFTYGNSAKPYQVTSVSLTDGDAFQDREQTISYTCYSRPSRLNEGGRSAAFTYNGSNERVKMYVADGASPVLTRYYIGGQYEIDLAAGKTVERLYLNGDAYTSPMVLVNDGTSGWMPYNIGRDYLGSITHIATADGVLVAEYSYDAWGRLRDPETHEAYLPGQEPELFLGRGFTGHEHLSWFGLINMNARLYDPVTGRFLSPDPNVQMLDFTQNFNRYSYGLNNPFVYIDENGEFILTTAIVIGAVIGAAFGVYEGYKIAESKGATGWDKAWYMIGGGLIGGAGGALGGWAGAAVGTAAAGAGIGGFVAGAYTGGAAGAVTGFVNGFGMSMLENPQNVGGALWQGIYHAGAGGLSGAAIGGLVQGTTSAIKGNNFWNGSSHSSASSQVKHHSVRDSYQKGVDGVNRAIDEYKAKGAELLSKEVSLDVNGTRVRVDAAFKLNGETILMEVKNGPHAMFTPNQSIAYPQMELGVPVIPRGANAGQVFGKGRIGFPVENYKFVVIRY